LNKYEILIDDKITHISNGITLYRIKALRDFGDVKAGDLGGFIQKEVNLSHDGNCWIYGHAKVFDNAKIINDAVVEGKAEVFDNAIISDKAKVGGSAKIYCNAIIYRESGVYDNAEVYGNAEIGGNCIVLGHAKVYGNSGVYDNAWVIDHAKVFDEAVIQGDARIKDRSKVYGKAEVTNKSVIAEVAEIFGKSRIDGEEVIVKGRSMIENATVINGKFMLGANLEKTSDYLFIRNMDSQNGFITAFKDRKGIGITSNFFEGSLKQFKESISKERNNKQKEYEALITIIECRLGGE